MELPHAARVKTALIGHGGIAQSHWRGIQSVATRIHVTAVVDTHVSRANEIANRTGARAFTSLDSAVVTWAR